MTQYVSFKALVGVEAAVVFDLDMSYFQIVLREPQAMSSLSLTEPTPACFKIKVTSYQHTFWQKFLAQSNVSFTTIVLVFCDDTMQSDCPGNCCTYSESNGQIEARLLHGFEQVCVRH